MLAHLLLQQLAPPGLVVVADSGLGYVGALCAADAAKLRFVMPLRADTGWADRFATDVGALDALARLEYCAQRQLRLPEADRTVYTGLLRPFGVTVEQVIVTTLEQSPTGGDTHWSTRSMAAATGLSQTAISRIWRAFGLKPHLVDTWKLSTDPQFIEKVRDIVGLYLDPPDAAMVLAVDEKSQMQALDRTAPVLPMMPAVPGRQTHDYIRRGTTSLFAALDVATGKVIGAHDRRHRHQEFLRFLKTIDANTPAELDLHLVLDNYATHKTPAIQKWLAAHPRFHLHFTPTYASWLNLAERWFAELTRRKLRRSSHRSLKALEADVTAWIEAWNHDPKPFVWTKTADEILANLAHYLTSLNQTINDSGH